VNERAPDGTRAYYCR